MEKLKLNKIEIDKDLKSFKERCYKEIINNKEFYSLISKDFNDEEIYKNVSKFLDT